LRTEVHPEEVVCDPADNPSSCAHNRRCEDNDGDGEYTCICDKRFYTTHLASGHCVLGLKALVYDMEKELKDLEMKQAQETNWLNDTLVELLELPTTTTTTTTTTTLPECPTGSNFMMYNGTCYAVEHGNRNYDDTQTRCGEIFGNGIGGKIFEPSSVDVCNDIVKDAGAIFSAEGRGDPYVWVGMTDRITEGTWAYESSGENPPDQPNCHTNKDDIDCTVMKVHYIGWYTFGCHQKCDISASAICEWVI